MTRKFISSPLFLGRNKGGGGGDVGLLEMYKLMVGASWDNTLNRRTIYGADAPSSTSSLKMTIKDYVPKHSVSPLDGSVDEYNHRYIWEYVLSLPLRPAESYDVPRPLGIVRSNYMALPGMTTSYGSYRLPQFVYINGESYGPQQPDPLDFHWEFGSASGVARFSVRAAPVLYDAGIVGVNRLQYGSVGPSLELVLEPPFYDEETQTNYTHPPANDEYVEWTLVAHGRLWSPGFLD